MSEFAIALMFCCPIVCGTIIWLARQKRKHSTISKDEWASQWVRVKAAEAKAKAEYLESEKTTSA